MSEPAQILASARALGKSYDEVEALREVSFELRQGQVLGLLGPNGAGKSTTLSLLLGFIAPSRGQVTLFGGPPADPANRRRVGYLPESPCFAAHHTPRSLLNFHARLLDIAESERSDRVSAALSEAGLESTGPRRVPSLSKGMLQRLGLAVALLGDPELLILDEPTSNLDPVGRRELCELVGARRERGRTAIFASHVLAEIEATCDRVLILNRGTVACQGSLDELCTAKGVTLESVFFESVQDSVEGEE